MTDIEDLRECHSVHLSLGTLAVFHFSLFLVLGSPAVADKRAELDDLTRVSSSADVAYSSFL